MTGSHVPETRNPAPNLRRAGSDSRSSTAKSRTVRASTAKAKNEDAFSNARSLGLPPARLAIPGWLPFRGEGKGGISPPNTLHHIARRGRRIGRSVQRLPSGRDL